jgi:protein-tyrosine phosphatase
MEFNELPLGLPGRVFRSAMPFSQNYDPAGLIYQAYKEHGVHTIVMLAPDSEALRRTGMDLQARYQRDGYAVIYLPVTDFTAPLLDELRTGVNGVLQALNAGHNAAVHCHAGIGRTGLFLACLAKQVLDLAGDDAILWLRQYVPGAVETDEQRQLVRIF